MSVLLAAHHQEVFWMAMVAIVAIPVVCHFAYQAWKTYQEIDLKREMIARGMSVDEIERVLSAGSQRRVDG